MKRSWKRIASVVFQILSILLAIGWIVNAIVVRGTPKDPDRDSWTRRDGFVAVSFGGIARTEDGVRVSRERMAEHLRALEEAGYSAVATEDLVNFYVEDEPLPDKPVYIMFEGGRKDSAIYGQEALSETGMRATMYVHPRLMDEWTQTFMTRGEVNALSRSEFWEVGTHGYEMYAPGSGDRERPVHYLADYLRDDAGLPAESFEQFAARAEKDYATARDILEQTTGRNISSYVFMPSNLIGNPPTGDADRINARLLDSHFQLAFTRDGIAFNGRDTDRHRLTRLQVAADMTPAELIGRLEPWLTVGDPYLYRGGIDSDRRWQADAGRVEYDPDGIAIVPDDGQNAFAWLAGSENWGNVDVQAELSVRPETELDLYLRFAGNQSFLRLRFAGGMVMVQERAPTRGIDTILTRPIPASPFVPVRLTARNRRLWVSVGGEPLTGEPLPLADIPEGGGRIAIGVKYGGAGPHQAFFRHMKIMPLPAVFRIADANLRMPLTWPGADDAGGVVIPLDQTDGGLAASDRAMASYLLRAASHGVETYAMLPPGSVELAPLADAVAGLPPLLATRLWSGAAFVYEDGMDLSGLALAAERARSDGLRTMLALTAGQAGELASGERLPPVDSVILTDGGDLSNPGMKALRRRYRRVMFWNSEKALYEER